MSETEKVRALPITDQNPWYLETKQYWSLYLPKMTAELTQSGELHQSLVSAVENARDLYIRLIHQEISSPEARTMAMEQFLRLQPEMEALQELEKW